MKSAERKTMNDKDKDVLTTSLTPELVVAAAAALADVADDEEGALDVEAVTEVLEEPDVDDEEPEPLDVELPELLD